MTLNNLLDDIYAHFSTQETKTYSGSVYAMNSGFSFNKADQIEWLKTRNVILENINIDSYISEKTYVIQRAFYESHQITDKEIVIKTTNKTHHIPLS